jgi:polyisoprenoid-binding protein YceI
MRFIFKLYILFVFAASLYADDWQVDKSADNLVQFYSTTTLLDFEGSTSNIDGYAYWEGLKFFGDNNEIYFEVQLATFSTGIGKRDRDMRDDVLETDKYPVASFNGTFIEVKQTGNKFDIVVSGAMSLHGHTKEMEINAVVVLEKDVMNVKCNFSIFLKDYNITAPDLLAFIKVAEEIKLTLDFNLVK